MKLNEIECKFDSIEEHREFLSNLLHTGIFNVTFTKVNGDTRIMPCTLKPELLPTVVISEEVKKEKKINPDVMSVFCIDKNEWRSFRIENIISITST